MIIRKIKFNLSGKKFRGNWPFTVSEIAVFLLKLDEVVCPAIVHEFNIYAMVGALENHGFSPLIDSGIWKDDPDNPDAKISITPFLKFIKKESVK